SCRGTADWTDRTTRTRTDVLARHAEFRDRCWRTDRPHDTRQPGYRLRGLPPEHRCHGWHRARRVGSPDRHREALRAVRGRDFGPGGRRDGHAAAQTPAIGRVLPLRRRDVLTQEASPQAACRRVYVPRQPAGSPISRGGRCDLTLNRPATRRDDSLERRRSTELDQRSGRVVNALRSWKWVSGGGYTFGGVETWQT